MNIVIHIPWGITKNFVGGTERFAINLAKGLNSKGQNAIIVCSNVEKLISIEGVDVIGIIPTKYANRVKKYGYANELFFKNEIIGEIFCEDSIRRFSDYVYEQIKELDCDILHLNSFLYSAALPSALNTSRVVITNHESPLEFDNYWGIDSFDIIRQFVNSGSSSLKKCSNLFTPSKYYAQEFSKYFNTQINYIHLGVDDGVFEGIKSNSLIKKGKTLRILLPSRFDPKQKGHDIAIKTFTILKSKGIKFHATFSGFDRDAYQENTPQLQKLLNKYNLTEHVSLTRFNNMADAYSDTDIVISPERFCSYGLSISESLYVGLPTLLSPIPTYKEISSGYPHAYIVVKNEPKYYGEKILKLLTEGSFDYSDGIIRFRQNNSFSTCVDKYLEIYENIAKKINI